MAETQLSTIDGLLALHFNRLVDTPIAQVWRAVSECEEIQTWFLPGGPWRRVSELGTLLGDPVGAASVDESRHEVSWTREDDRYDFHLVEQGTHTLLELTVPVDAPEDAPASADFIDSFLDRLAPYLAGDDVSSLGGVDLDETERRIEEYAQRFGVDPARGRGMVAGIRAAIEDPADVQPWHFEPSQEAADALEERMTAYLREHKEAFDAANARSGSGGDRGLMVALDEWILASATSAAEVGDRHFFVMDRYLADESIAVQDLERAWQNSRSDR